MDGRVSSTLTKVVSGVGLRRCWFVPASLLDVRWHGNGTIHPRALMQVTIIS